ncbi:MAG: hypothetical protein LBU32_17060 [Clostridiales bacterium]|nr:hypothetical protein [Clostridiales bacterium]
MILIVSALQLEAEPFIARNRMKRVLTRKSLQLFKGGSAMLAVCGSGPVGVAVAVSEIMSFAGVNPDRDLIANIGMAGGRPPLAPGDIAVCNKIACSFTGRTLYPEMLISHPFKEGALESFGKPVHGGVCGLDLADMEGAFFWEAASFYLPASRIHCIKVVSDAFEPESVSRKLGASLMKNAAATIYDWLEAAAEALLPDDVKSALDERQMRALDEVCVSLHLTFAMKSRLEALCKKANARSMDFLPILREEALIRAEGKKEGKLRYEKLIQRFVQ